MIDGVEGPGWQVLLAEEEQYPCGGCVVSESSLLGGRKWECVGGLGDAVAARRRRTRTAAGQTGRSGGMGDNSELIGCCDMRGRGKRRGGEFQLWSSSDSNLTFL